MDVRSLYELPKDMLVKIITMMRDVRNMSNEELVLRQTEMQTEQVRRKNKIKCYNIKRGLVNLRCIPYLKDFILQNMKNIQSMKQVSDVYITLGAIKYPIYEEDNPFLTELNNFYLYKCNDSLLNNIYSYLSEGADISWITAKHIEYDSCPSCRRHEISFIYDTYNSYLILEENKAYHYKTTSHKYFNLCKICNNKHCFCIKCINEK